MRASQAGQLTPRRNTDAGTATGAQRAPKRRSAPEQRGPGQEAAGTVTWPVTERGARMVWWRRGLGFRSSETPEEEAVIFSRKALDLTAVREVGQERSLAGEGAELLLRNTRPE